jgi:hypothetical protein
MYYIYIYVIMCIYNIYTVYTHKYLCMYVYVYVHVLYMDVVQYVPVSMSMHMDVWANRNKKLPRQATSDVLSYFWPSHHHEMGFIGYVMGWT